MNGLVAALLLAIAGPAAGTPTAVEIGLQARSLAPGEPVRIRVEPPVSARSLQAEFLDMPVFLVPDPPGPDGSRRWSGWTLVPLDAEPGPAVIEVHGSSGAGEHLVGTRAVSIEARSFPREELTVASRYVEPSEQTRSRLARERRRLAEIYRSRLATPTQRSPFVRPVPGAPTSVFGTRRVFNGEPRAPHPGLDLKAGTGTPVQASGTGRVVLARDLYYSGNTVILDHGGGLFTLYAHLEDMAVAEGQDVTTGHVVGRSGATGRVTGPHLHWGAKIGDRPFDPEALLDPSLF